MPEHQRIEVPGGWIYHSGFLAQPILVLDPAVWAPGATIAGEILAAINDLKQDIQNMSTTISGELDAETALLQGDLSTLTAGITSLENQLATAVAALTPGTTITEDQVAAVKAVHTSFAALAASIPSVAAAAPVTSTSTSTTAPAASTTTASTTTADPASPPAA